MNKTLVYVPITKFEKDPVTGFVTAYGKMTGPDLDLDKQICDDQWIAKAVPEWFTSGANVRQMHQNDAVGVGTELEKVGADYWLKSLIVDPVAGDKVVHKVFTGYSIGIFNPKVIKDPAAPGGRIVGGFIGETSLVDRPANPTCKFVTSKMAGAQLRPAAEWITKDMAIDTAGTGTEPATLVDAGEESAELDAVAQIRALLDTLIAQEAGELAAGTGTTSPVRILIWMRDDLDYYVSCDAYDDVMTSLSAAKALTSQEDTVIKLAAVADLVKAATADTATPEDKTQLDVLRKGLGLDAVQQTADEAKKIAADALTKASAAEEPVAGFADRLAKVEQMAAPGGPTRTRPEQDATKAAALDARLDKAADYRRLARTVNDRELAAEYTRLADELDPPTS